MSAAKSITNPSDAMLIQEVRVMRGPNMWSHSHSRVLAIKMHPSTPSISTGQLQAISDYLAPLAINESDDAERETLLLRLTVRLAAALQGSEMFHGLRAPTSDLTFGVVEYEVEQAGTVAVELASSILASLLEGGQPPTLAEAAALVLAARQRYGEGPSTTMIIDAARSKNIPVTPAPGGYTILGYGKHQKKISAAMSHNTSCIAVNIAGNKEHTKKFLESAALPVPKGVVVAEELDLEAAAERLGFPLVAKPFNGNQGRNVTCGIYSLDALRDAFRHAKELSRSVIVEKEISGSDYRILVIGGKFAAASLRSPAMVIGDGIRTVAELVEQENNNPMRGQGHENALTKIRLDQSSETVLASQGLNTGSIPVMGSQVCLKSTANLSTGGTAEDVTDLVHPLNIRAAEKAARVIGLDICGIDIVSGDIALPLPENGAAIIEVNAAPGLRMHKFPSRGPSREVGPPIVELMFPHGDQGRIPIVAITGTNGKTTTTRLMAHVASSAGKTVGFSSTDGIYIGSEKIQSGDCSGPQSARTILHDTTVDFAVLECARGGIIRSGLGFDQCDIAIVTNVAADHLGLKDIHTVSDLAVVKSVVPRSVHKDGWAILNASDDHAFAMRDTLRCRVALFCTDHENPRLQEHLNAGGTAVYMDAKQDIYVCHEEAALFMLNAAEAPITRKGLAGFMIENLLPVALAAHLSGFRQATIAEALRGFVPSAEHTPGRINEFEINGVNVIVDYAHNPHGLLALSGYLKNIRGFKTGIITGTGDRREEDIVAFGRIAAAMYDRIIIRFDRDLRGRSQEQILEILASGIRDKDPGRQFEVIPDTQTAIHHAVATAEKGSFVVICADNATYTVGLTKIVAAQFQPEAQ